MIEKYRKILGVSTQPTIVEVKSNYREKAKNLHPDRNRSVNATEDFILLTEAYQYFLNYISNQNKINITDQDLKWEKSNQEKARRYAQRHANMGYSSFEKSRLFKSVNMFVVFYDYLMFFVGIVLIVMSIVGIFLNIKTGFYEHANILTTLFSVGIGYLFLYFTYKNVVRSIKRFFKSQRSGRSI